jgi:uncharacterized protein (DUF488 family)
MNCARVYSVGHSNGTLPAFVALLLQSDIQTLVDVRSQPYSRYAPQFNLSSLKTAIENAGIRYAHLGRELGGRPVGREFYDVKGHVDYGRVADSPLFRAGIDALLTIGGEARAAVMCSEEDPLCCHRRLLIGRVLHDLGVSMVHIRADGGLEAEQTFGRRPQLALFGAEVDAEWKSIRSVLQNDRQPISLAH